MKKSLLALTLLAAAPFAASAAEGVSYNYVEGGYAASKISGPDADGWAIGGSGAIAPNFHVFGNYNSQKIDNTSVDFDQWRVGGGYNRSISDRTDFVGQLAYEKLDAGAGIKAEGYSAEAGVRSMMTPNIEGYAMLGYQDGDDFDGDAYGRLGAAVKFNQNWGATAEVGSIRTQVPICVVASTCQTSAHAWASL